MSPLVAVRHLLLDEIRRDDPLIEDEHVRAAGADLDVQPVIVELAERLDAREDAYTLLKMGRRAYPCGLIVFVTTG